MSTIEQLKRIDSACVAFELNWTPELRLDETTLMELAWTHQVAEPERLLVELLLLDWQQNQATDRTFQPEQTCAQWSNFAAAFEAALQEYGSWQKRANRTAKTPVCAPLSAGVMLGPYRIRCRIGAGGMGDVYAAEDTRLGRAVAIKILARHLTQNPLYVKRFAREAATVARLSHPNIVTLFDLGEVEVAGQNVAFVVMEYLEGETLRERLEHDRIAVQQAVQIASQLSNALDAAHLQSVVHRDIKPENIFLTADGRVKILDFGLARLSEESTTEHQQAIDGSDLTQIGAVLGTSGYMAPEQVRGEIACAASDLFSLTCVLYEMLTGQRAFQGESRADMASATLRDDPVQAIGEGKNAAFPTALIELLTLGLHKNPGLRIRSANEYSRRLAVIAADVANEQLVRPIGMVSESNVVASSAWGAMPFQRWLVPIVFSVLLFAAALASYGVGGSSQVAVASPLTIAVLPFTCESDPIAASRLTMALTDALASESHFCVRPFSMVARWNWESSASILDDPQIARLKADTVATGQITLEGTTAHIHVELVNVAKGNLIWSRMYSGARDAIPGLCNGIRNDIAARLGGRCVMSIDPSSLAYSR